jgi:hypothetical protein
MITEWPGVKPPDDENATIWRYIDFAKFVDMLDQSTLHFASLRTLEARSHVPAQARTGNERRSDRQGHRSPKL